MFLLKKKIIKWKSYFAVVVSVALQNKINMFSFKIIILVYNILITVHFRRYFPVFMFYVTVIEFQKTTSHISEITENIHILRNFQ